MRKLMCLLIVILVAGCSTIPVLQTENHTAADVKAAMCKDATDGYNLAEAMLKDPAVLNEPEASAYWNTYKIGAKIVIDANCASTSAK